MSFSTVNPSTGNVIQTYSDMTDDTIHRIIASCYDACLPWSRLSISKRSACALSAADALNQNKEILAQLLSNEMGKMHDSAIAEIEKCALLCRHLAEHAESWLESETVQSQMSVSKVICRPLGIVFGIMPWNYPFWQVFRFAIPAMLAGNGALLKHAPITTGCALEIESLLMNCGFPEHLFRTLIISNDSVESVISHPHVSAVTFTGSERTGRIIAIHAGKHLKKVVLELGGSDPYIVLEDADPVTAAKAIVASRMNNSGQSCIAAKRIITVRSVRSALENAILAELKPYTSSDPVEASHSIAPLARLDLRTTLHQQVQTSVDKGAHLITGGKMPEGLGFYYPVTVLSNVQKGMPAWEEELFGPVFSLIDAEDMQEAIHVANNTRYGLGAAIFTRDIDKALQLAEQDIQAGTVFINDFVRSDPALPFGGIKNSGFGRELAKEGIREFVNIKTIAVK